MKRLAYVFLTILIISMFPGCTKQSSEDVAVVAPVSRSVVDQTKQSPEYVAPATQYPPKTIQITVNGESKTITPFWLQLEGAGCIARDVDTGMLYTGNEVGEYAPYVPDLAVVDSSSVPDLPKTITPIGGTKIITPVWLQFENGSVIARDTNTGMLYAGNEVGEYAPYVPDLATCTAN